MIYDTIKKLKGKIAVVYHSEDFDGWYSHFLMSQILDSPFESIPGDYSNRRITADNLANFDTIIMVDYSLVPEDMKAIASRLIWIDHHKRNYENILSKLGLTMQTKPKWWILDHTKAACELCLDIYATGADPDRHKRIVDLLGSYDVRREERPDWDNILAFQYGLRAIQGPEIALSASIYLPVLSGRFREDGIIYDIIKNGYTILSYLKTMFTQNIDNGNILNYEGLKLYLLNSTPSVGSLAFEVPIEHTVLDQVDICMSYRWSSEEWVCGFYSNRENVDCSKIAAKFGGGGHPGAAGCTMSDAQLRAFITRGLI